VDKKFGWAAVGAAVAFFISAVVVGLFLFARGYEVDASGTGFTTAAEATILFGGLALAVIAAVLGFALIRTRATTKR